MSGLMNDLTEFALKGNLAGGVLLDQIAAVRQPLTAMRY